MILASNARARLKGFHDHPHGIRLQYLAVKRQGLHLAERDPPVPVTGFAKSLLKAVNSLATVKLVGSDSSLEIQIPPSHIDARWVMSATIESKDNARRQE
jgi:hypothetical protein